MKAQVRCWLAALSISLCTAPGNAAQEAARDAFALGVQAYRTGDLDSATTLWLGELEDSADDSQRAETLFNLGNAAWRRKKPLEALAWYTACIRIEPRHADAWTNLEFVRSAAGLEPADRGDLGATLRRLLSVMTVAESEWLVLASSALLTLLLAAHAWRGGAFLRRCAWGAGVLVLVSLPPWIFRLRQQESDEVFVVSPEGAAVHSEPRAEATELEKLPPAAVVLRRDRLPGWVKVESSDRQGGQSGWVREETVFALARSPSGN